MDVDDRKRGIHVGEHISSVNTSCKWYKNQPFVLTCQATQVFYLKDSSLGGNWLVVQRMTNRNMYNVPIIPLVHDDDNEDHNLDFAAF